MVGIFCSVHTYTSQVRLHAMASMGTDGCGASFITLWLMGSSGVSSTPRLGGPRAMGRELHLGCWVTEWGTIWPLDYAFGEPDKKLAYGMA